MTLVCVYDFCLFTTSVWFLNKDGCVLCREKMLCETPDAQVNTQGYKISSSQSLHRFLKKGFKYND